MPFARAPFCIIQEGKQKSRDLAEAVIAGYGSGEIGYCTPESEISEQFTPVIIGVHPTTVKTLHALRFNRRPFVTVDNGYMRGYREGGYYRATSNALQWIASRPGSGVGRDVDCTAIGRERFEALDLEVKPWQVRDPCGHFLVVLQSKVWLEMMRESPTWVDSVVREIKAYTNREVIVRAKPVKGEPQPPLEQHFENCSGVIGFSSNVLLKAAMAGIPICTLAYAATSPLGCGTIPSLILNRPFPERESILHALAANQWTIEEIASGNMWLDLAARYEPDFLRLA